MSSSKRLPFELLADIVSYLADDILSLRNVSLSSHTLDIVTKPYLFAVMDFRHLSHPPLVPFRHYVKEVQLTWKLDMYDGEADVFERLFTPYISPETTPRLNSLVISAIGTSGMAYLGTLGKLFERMPGITSLSLKHTHHHDVQTLICALPRLKHLRLDGVMWQQGELQAESQEARACGPALESLHVSATFPGCSQRLVEWLAATPSADSLRTLAIPFQAHNAPALAPLFGPSVHRLALPLRRLQACSLERYTALQDLTLMLGQYHACVSRWTELPVVLAALPAPASLRALTLRLELDLARQRGGAELSEAVVCSEMLQAADRVLFAPSAQDGKRGGAEGEDEGEGEARARPSRFSALQEVRFVVRTSLAVGEEKRVAFGSLVERLMGETRAHGKLVVDFESRF